MLGVMWYDNGVGKIRNQQASLPAYIYPADLVAVIRQRFQDPEAGKRDAESATATGPGVYYIT